MLTVSMDSSAGTYEAICGSQTFVALAPSIRVLFAARFTPFVFHDMERDGFEPTECGVLGGVIPGIVTKSA